MSIGSIASIVSAQVAPGCTTNEPGKTERKTKKSDHELASFGYELLTFMEFAERNNISLGQEIQGFSQSSGIGSTSYNSPSGIS